MPTPILRTDCFELTTDLTTPLIIAEEGQTIRILHILASCGTTGGTITLSKSDSSKSVTANLWNAKSILANGNLEYFDTVLEAGDSLNGGYTAASNAQLIIDYQVLQS